MWKTQHGRKREPVTPALLMHPLDIKSHIAVLLSQISKARSFPKTEFLVLEVRNGFLVYSLIKAEF